MISFNIRREARSERNLLRRGNIRIVYSKDQQATLPAQLTSTHSHAPSTTDPLASVASSTRRHPRRLSLTYFEAEPESCCEVVEYRL